MSYYLTDEGRKILYKAYAGQEFNIKHIEIGNGIIGGQDMHTLKGLISPKMSIAIGRLDRKEDKVIIGAFLNNKDLEEGFYLRELGIFVEEPDTKEEVLCFYRYFGDKAEYIYSKTESVMEEWINLDLIISDEINVTAKIDESLVFINRKEFEEKMANQIIISEEVPVEEQCVWYQILNSKPMPSGIAEIMLEVANEYDANSTYQLETITNMTDNESDENKIIEREE